MTLSTSHWVSLQDEGSNILCGKEGALKITPNDCLNQKYLTILNLIRSLLSMQFLVLQEGTITKDR